MSDSPNTPSFLPPADLAKELSAPDSGSPGDESIRPSRLEDFIGQEELRANLRVFLNAARERGQAMDHVLFYGNPGLGKTTLAQIMAAELGVNLICTSGPVLERSGDLAAILTNLSRHDILFVDEIHRMPIAVEEILYPALEDYKLDLVIGQGPAARTVKIDLEPFTLVGATTRIGLLSSPLRDRFGIISRLEFYTPEELSRVVIRSSRILGVPITEGGALEIGRGERRVSPTGCCGACAISPPSTVPAWWTRNRRPTRSGAWMWTRTGWTRWTVNYCASLWTFMEEGPWA